MRRPSWVSGVVASLAICGACDLKPPPAPAGATAKGNQVYNAPILEITPKGDVVTVSQGTGVGTERDVTLTLINTGEVSLEVSGVSLQYDPLPTEIVPAFRLDRIDAGCTVGPPCADETIPLDSDSMSGLRIRNSPVDPNMEGYDYANVVVVYHRPADSDSRTATLTIVSDSDPGDVRTITLATQPGIARMKVTPKEVAFAPTALGQTATENIVVSSVGSEPLRIDSIEFVGSSAFSMTVGDLLYDAGQTLSFDPPHIIQPGDSRNLAVHFAPQTLDSASALLTIHANDPLVPAGVDVMLDAAQEVPCLTVSPSSLDFGLRPVGEVSTATVVLASCGTTPVSIGSISLDPEGSPDFTLEIPFQPPPGGEGTAAVPTELPVNGKVTLAVRYTPLEPSAEDAGGELLYDATHLIIESSSFTGQTTQVEVRGAAVPFDCPLPVLTVEPGPIVSPQTVVQLTGDQSMAPGSDVTKWHWEVEQPPGSAVTFEPSDTAPDPTVRLDVVGTYRFRLSVEDQLGTPSCFVVAAQVQVVSGPAIYVELVWSTPGDPDPTDEGKGKGTDLDLHLLHPAATGPDVDGDGAPDGWFDVPFDCYWANPTPNWGSTNPIALDDPQLERDDSDGAGPEIVVLDNPQKHAVYSVGVHYFADSGFGPSAATVRIYVYGELRYEEKDVELDEGDLWKVATIDWPSGATAPIRDFLGLRTIVHDYPRP